MVGAEALQAVVEVRQVDERQRGALQLEDAHRAAADPARALDAGRRPPESEQRELSELTLQFVAKLRRVGVDIRQLAPVGRVHRTRRDRIVGRRIHVVPPEELGAGERRIEPLRRVPQPFAVHQMVRLAPEPHFGEVAEIPAVRDDAMLARQSPGDERRLHGRRDGRRDRRQRTHCAPLRDATDVRCMLQQRGGETHDVQYERTRHHWNRRDVPLGQRCRNAAGNRQRARRLDVAPGNIVRPSSVTGRYGRSYATSAVGSRRRPSGISPRYLCGRDRAVVDPVGRKVGGLPIGRHPRRDAGERRKQLPCLMRRSEFCPSFPTLARNRYPSTRLLIVGMRVTANAYPASMTCVKPLLFIRF